jgi:GlpG protein
MIRIAEIPNPRLAQAFVDYMAKKNVALNIAPSDDKYAIWLKDEAHHQLVSDEFSEFARDPMHPKYSQASWDMAESRNARFHYHAPSFGHMLKERAGPITLLMMGLCALVFFFQVLGRHGQVFSWLHFPSTVEQSYQVWRWFTHAIMHFSILHIAFNLLWWWDLGGKLEKTLGAKPLLAVFLLSATTSGLGQYFVEGANFGGLSGVVYGLVGFWWLVGQAHPQYQRFLPKPILGFMLVWLVIGYVQPFMAIANTAHLVGLISGAAYGYWYAKTKIAA